jgi:hypothetical protein
VFATSFLARYLSWTSSCTARCKIFRRAVNPPKEYKQFIISQFPNGENHIFLFMFCIDVIKFTARWEIFTVRWEKSLAMRELVQGMYWARNFLNFNIENENFKISNPYSMRRKFQDKQWNRQNSILFHETIHLRLEPRSKKCKDDN